MDETRGRKVGYLWTGEENLSGRTKFRSRAGEERGGVRTPRFGSGWPEARGRGQSGGPPCGGVPCGRGGACAGRAAGLSGQLRCGARAAWVAAAAAVRAPAVPGSARPRGVAGCAWPRCAPTFSAFRWPPCCSPYTMVSSGSPRGPPRAPPGRRPALLPLRVAPAWARLPPLPPLQPPPPPACWEPQAGRGPRLVCRAAAAAAAATATPAAARAA